MPIYAQKCQRRACGHSFETFARITDDRTRIKCPKCGGRRTRTVPSLPHSGRRFAGSQRKSLVEGFHKKEVKRARKLVPSYQHCIKDSGAVEFDSRQEERGFKRALDRAYRRILPENGVEHWD